MESMIKIKIDETIKAMMETIMSHGETIYIVGGYIRDQLLGKTSMDIDMATSGKAEDIYLWLNQYHPNKDHIKYGCINLKLNGYTIEITTMRKDSLLSDGRRPEYIEYTDDIQQDALRRDFTINAIYCDVQGHILDPTGGIKDMDGHTIDTPIDPDLSFNQDHLRMLRAIRMVATTGFDLSDRVQQALTKHQHQIKKLSSYRIGSEFNAILVQPYLSKVWKDLEWIFHDVMGLSIPLIPLVKPLHDLTMIYAYIFRLYNKDQLKWAANRLNLSAAMVNTILQLIPLLPDDTGKMTMVQTKSLAALKPSSPILMDFNTLTGKDVMDEVDHYQKMDIVLHQKQIHLTTSEMAKVGIKQYEFRFVYRYLLLALYNNEVKNKKDALMEYIKDHRHDIRRFIMNQ